MNELSGLTGGIATFRSTAGHGYYNQYQSDRYRKWLVNQNRNGIGSNIWPQTYTHTEMLTPTEVMEKLNRPIEFPDVVTVHVAKPVRIDLSLIN